AAWNAKYEAFLAWASVSAESLRLESRDEGLTLRASKSVLAAIEMRLKSATSATKQNGAQPPFTQATIQTRKSSSSSLECEELTRFREQLAALREEHTRVQAEEIAEACIPLWASLHLFQTEWIAWITSIDESQALARAAVQLNLVRPTLSAHLDREEPCEEDGAKEGAAVEVNGLRHPLIEAMATREAYVKHSVSLGFERTRALLVYGVNASGKSSLMKALAISVLLAQAGSFVPADSMRLRPFRSLYSRIWNQDNLFTGHSSFAVEMSELRDILRHSNQYSLVLGDEVCAGTESQSATALVGAALEWLDTKRTCFLFATHLHDLLKVPGLLPRSSIEVCHLRVDIDRATGKLVYDRRL
ncbi:hypothetical protein EBZ37_14855, partial [bacterium]|nr:hypothetical protein [bacterium]